MRSLFPGIRPGRLTYRVLRDGDEVVDEVLAVLYGGNGDRPVAEEGEISFHGGRVAHEALLGFLVKRGAREAEPGRYLAQSLRYDAIQQEALVNLVEATTRRQVAFLLRQVRGELGAAVRAVLETAEGGDHAARTAALLAQGPVGLHMARGARILVAGPPNVGKSALVNRLCGTDRSIVTHVPGTTRDLLEAPADVEGFPVVFLDSCGIAFTGSALDCAGTRRVVAEVPSVDLVLCLGLDPAAISAAAASSVRLGPKADLGHRFDEGVLPVSGLTGQGVAALRSAIAQRLAAGGDWRRPAPFTPRQMARIAEADTAYRRGDRDAGASALEGVIEGR
jgi:tRNA modification GTPase